MLVAEYNFSFSVEVAVATVDGSPPTNVTIGADVYPLPALVIVIDVTVPVVPPDNTAIPSAANPPGNCGA